MRAGGPPSEEELAGFVERWWAGYVTFDAERGTTAPVLDEVHPAHFADFARDLLAEFGGGA